MKIFLIRHGESQSNYDKKHGKDYFCGQMDVQLTVKGLQSAQALKEEFEQKDIDRVYVSDLTRTKQTYGAIFDKAIPTTVTSTLRERSLGLFEGTLVSDLKQNPTYPAYFNDENYKSFRHSFTQKAPEGESYTDVLNRVKQFFEKEVDPSLETIAVVAHQVVIRCMMVYLGYDKQETAIDREVDNCVPYVVEKDY